MGSIATVRHFRKPLFTPGVILTELVTVLRLETVAVFNRNGWWVWGGICSSRQIGELLHDNPALSPYPIGTAICSARVCKIAFFQLNIDMED